MILILVIAMALIGPPVNPPPTLTLSLTPATTHAWMRAPHNFGQPDWIGETR